MQINDPVAEESPSFWDMKLFYLEYVHIDYKTS